MNLPANGCNTVELSQVGKMADISDDGLVNEIVHSHEFVLARRRVFRQLLQALIYEQTIEAKERETADGFVEFSILGADVRGDKTTYTCRGIRRPSFGRVRLTDEPVLRATKQNLVEADSVSLFLQEIRPSFTVEPEFLSRFCRELEHTLLNHAMSLFYLQRVPFCLRNRGYDDIESGLNEAHPYHPCFKSRIGFDIQDNAAFGPEFGPDIKLLWLAVRKSASIAAVSKSVVLNEFLHSELGETCLGKFQYIVREHEECFENYVLVPVHPWQWRKIICVECLLDLRKNDIIYLGVGEDRYRPQQSIRTLANATDCSKSYVKLALGILNTSTTRGLAEHTVINAPVISDWLKRIAREDLYISQQLKLILLGEVACVSYSPTAEHATAGSLACIWRESLHRYLEDGENAIPFSGLTTLDRDGLPIIDEWVTNIGVKRWLEQLLDVSVTPLIHMLYAHGIALESHGQNMVLIIREGAPNRVALKDFHDGIRFIRSDVSYVEYADELAATPAQHLRNNSTSYIEATHPDDVRDFLYSAFFSMNLSEIALFLAEHFSLREEEFWRMTADCIERYQKSFPELGERFKLFDLFADAVVVEAHTKRRLQSEKVQRINHVYNPLAQFRRWS